MLSIEGSLSRLTEHHQAVLRWFARQAGQEGPWPWPLSDGTLLASRAKGIYKPAWTEYALSVRQSLDGPYSDRDPVVRSNGTWSYDYFQENSDPDRRDTEYTNRGLIRCMEDGVPVGVFRQVARRPSRYRILGLALVVEWDSGYFHLEGFTFDGLAYDRRARAAIDALLDRYESEVWDSGYGYDAFEDTRDFTVASIVRRRGQDVFRSALIDAYRGRCAISGCDAEPALEACHIRPYRGPQTNTASNGLLLRADLHTLFDLGLVAVDTPSMTCLIATELQDTTYVELAGKPVAVPATRAEDSNLVALDCHRRWSGLFERGKFH